MPALDALQDRFAAANTQVLGASVDSLHCHANWAQSLGGISFPLLADFHPKGAVADSFGMYLGEKGITDRATVIIDAAGVVQHASSVTPAGERDMKELAALCEKVNADFSGELKQPDAAPGLPADAVLYVRSNCGFSRATLMAAANLHSAITVKNVSDDPAALEALRQASGQETAPCLVAGGKALLESPAIVAHMVKAVSGL